MNRAVDIVLFTPEFADDCNNVGPCCFSCPHFDACDHHYDEASDD